MRALPLTLVLLATPAAADPVSDADAHLAAGVALAAEGRNQEAIARFKAAERSFPRAEHDCNIALVYLRLENWHRAHFFLSRCDARKPMLRPAWVDRRRAELETRLKEGFGQVVLQVSPADSQVLLSAFAPDESIAPDATVWVPRGPLTVRGSAPGYVGGKTQIVVGDAPATARLDLVEEKPVAVTVTSPPKVTVSAKPEPVPPVVEVAPPPESTRPPVGPWILIGAGVGAAVAGGVLHVSASEDNDKAAGLTKGEDDWQEVVDRRDAKDVAAVSLYGLGGAALVGGVVWLLWPDSDVVAFGPTGMSWRLSWR